MNYMAHITEDILSNGLHGIREVFLLADDVQPKWYLEPGIRTLAGKGKNTIVLIAQKFRVIQPDVYEQTI